MEICLGEDDYPKTWNILRSRPSVVVLLWAITTFKTLPFKCGLPERDNLILTSSVPKDSRIGYEVIYEAGKYTVSRHNATHLSFFLGLTKERRMAYRRCILYMNNFGVNVTEVHITRVKTSFPDADTFFQPDLTVFEKVGEDIDVSGEDLEAYVEVWRRV